jgi:hypothetical protein
MIPFSMTKGRLETLTRTCKRGTKRTRPNEARETGFIEDTPTAHMAGIPGNPQTSTMDFSFPLTAWLEDPVIEPTRIQCIVRGIGIELSFADTKQNFQRDRFFSHRESLGTRKSMPIEIKLIESYTEYRLGCLMLPDAFPLLLLLWAYTSAGLGNRDTRPF